MIVSNPSDAALQSADTISLFDPRRPEWHELIVAAGARPLHGQGYLVLDIPVDSLDQARIEVLKSRIAAARQ
jgi:hypothetical protein